MSGDKLSDYPCGFRDEWHGQQQCSEKCPAVEMERPCPLLPVFRAHIALRADMRKLRAAVLGGMLLGDAPDIYRRAADLCEAIDEAEDANMLNALADVVAKL